jgi:hypothetical protein
MDDSAASLLNRIATPFQWRYQLAFSDNEMEAVDTILFQPDAWLTERVKELARAQGFSHLCYLPNTKFAALSRLTSLSNCDVPKVLKSSRINTKMDVFNYMLGWSYKEALGRWTIGADVVLPAIKKTPYDFLCFKGHGFVPNESSIVSVSVYSSGSQLLGEFQYNLLNPDGERCVPMAAGTPTENSEISINMKIVGYSSPESHNLSADDRALGVFVEEIYLKRID